LKIAGHYIISPYLKRCNMPSIAVDVGTWRGHVVCLCVCVSVGHWPWAMQCSRLNRSWRRLRCWLWCTVQRTVY